LATAAPVVAIGPFGNPDGSRADLDEVLDSFIDFDGNPAFGALATRANDSMVRVIVGKPGAGKTVYLRTLQSYQRSQESVYAEPPEQSPPSTDVIVEACQWFDNELERQEKWRLLWSRAILRALSSHLLSNRELRNYPTDAQTRELRENYTAILGSFGKPRSVYHELHQIIHEVRNLKGLRAYLSNPLWEELLVLLTEILPACPPIYLYLDAVDEEFDHAPMYWLSCQLGLFYQVMRLLRDQRVGGRLHVVICIRDIVLSSVYRSEHASRYIDEPHIRVLSWDRSALAFLLQRKLERLDGSLFMTEPSNGRTVADWLGHRTILNSRRGIEERIEDYLLRHMRPIPRDLIAMGNALAQEVARTKNNGLPAIPQDRIRDVVSMTARRIANSQLAQCANQIAADTMPDDAARHGYSSNYTAPNSYVATGLSGVMKQIIESVAVDRFPPESLQAMRELATEQWGQATDLPSVLWQNGLLGYVPIGENRSIFYTLGGTDDFSVPERAQSYVLHPCLIDALDIKGTGQEPVVPF
jgi:hypothetical protein